MRSISIFIIDACKIFLLLIFLSGNFANEFARFTHCKNFQKFIILALKNMNFRLMNIDDYERVYALWMSCAGMGLNNLDDSKEGIAKFLSRNPETCFVAEVDEKIVGVILVGNDGRRGYIYHTAVNPDFRNQGIAKRLVQKSLGALQTIGINKVALVVFSKNETGNAFWEKLGFTLREDLAYRNKAIAEMVRIDT